MVVRDMPPLSACRQQEGDSSQPKIQGTKKMFGVLD